jgi:hypothetical protein
MMRHTRQWVAKQSPLRPGRGMGAPSQMGGMHLSTGLGLRAGRPGRSGRVVTGDFLRWVFFDPGWSSVLSRPCRNKSGLDLCPGRSATCQIGLAWRLLGSDLATRARDDRYGPRCQARWQSSPPSACGGVGNDPDSRQSRRPELSHTRRRPSSDTLWAHAPAVGGRALVLLDHGRRRRARAYAARRGAHAPMR